MSWTGFIKDRDEIYSGLDVLAAPAIDEGFGLTVAEAEAMAVVAARSGAFPEVVQEGPDRPPVPSPAMPPTGSR